MTLSKEQQQQLESLVRSLQEWMNQNCHPHVVAVVDSERMELLEGITTVQRTPHNSISEAESPGKEQSTDMSLDELAKKCANHFCLIGKPTPPQAEQIILQYLTRAIEPLNQEIERLKAEIKPFEHAVRCPSCRNWMNQQHDTECLNCGTKINQSTE